jgi:hypothetical protein
MVVPFRSDQCSSRFIYLNHRPDDPVPDDAANPCAGGYRRVTFWHQPSDGRVLMAGSQATVGRHRALVVPTDDDARTAAVLDALARAGARVLRDRRVPGSRETTDLVVTADGVWVVEAEQVRGRPRLVERRGAGHPRLLVGRTSMTGPLRRVRARAGLVREVVGPEVPVHPVLCLEDADWPLLGGALRVGDVDVLWPDLLPRLVTGTTGAHAREVDVHTVHHRLNVVFRVS